MKLLVEPNRMIVTPKSRQQLYHTTKESTALRDNFACMLEISDETPAPYGYNASLQTRFPGQAQCDETFLVEVGPEEQANPAQSQVLSFK